MRAFRAATLTTLHDKLCDTLINAKEDELDVVSTVDVQIHDTVSVAESMAWEFDLKNMWLTPSRWTMMINQYIDPALFEVWMNQGVSKIGVKDRGMAVMRTRTVAARGGAATGHTNKETRRWGSCMLALGYKAQPRPTISLWSRTSYLGYIGALDLSVAWACARQLGLELRLTPEEFRFVWYNSALQWHNFKSLAYLLNHHEKDRRKAARKLLLTPMDELPAETLKDIQQYPAMWLSMKWMKNMLDLDAAGATYGDMSYNTYRRIRRRYHTEVLGYERAKEFEGWTKHKIGPSKGENKDFQAAYKPLPHCPVETLTLAKVGWPLDRRTGMRYDDANDSEEAYDDEWMD